MTISSSWRSSRACVSAELKAVDCVTLDIRNGEHSGYWASPDAASRRKSTTGRAILQLVRPTSGSVRCAGTDHATLTEREMRSHRLRLQMIFQNPYAWLNPRMTVGSIVADPMRNFRLGFDDRQVSVRTQEPTNVVGLDPRM